MELKHLRKGSTRKRVDSKTCSRKGSITTKMDSKGCFNKGRSYTSMWTTEESKLLHVCYVWNCGCFNLSSDALLHPYFLIGCLL